MNQDYTLCLDFRMSERPIDDMKKMFAIAHAKANYRAYFIDFPAMKTHGATKQPLGVFKYLTHLGHRMRFFGERTHLDAIALESHSHWLAEGVTACGVKTPDFYVALTSRRPRKSAAKAAERLGLHLERQGINIERPITLGSQDYVAPDSNFIDYRSLSTGSPMRFFIQRAQVQAHIAGQASSFGFGGVRPAYMEDIT